VKSQIIYCNDYKIKFVKIKCMDNIKDKIKEIENSITHIKKRQQEIRLYGIPKEDTQEPKKSENYAFNHLEAIRVNYKTQITVLDEIEKTDKITKMALNVAWVSLGASIISLSATIFLYVTNILQDV